MKVGKIKEIKTVGEFVILKKEKESVKSLQEHCTVHRWTGTLQITTRTSCVRQDSTEAKAVAGCSKRR